VPALPAVPVVTLDRSSPAVLEEHLGVGEVRAYEVVLAAGEYLQLRIEQRGIDLVLTLEDPAGKERIRVDNWSGADGTLGPERVCWVAEVAGIHRVEVRGVKSGATGTYEIALEALRPAGERDRRRASAEVALEAGALEEALAGFRELGERHREADALFRLAELREQEAERGRDPPTAALEFYAAALALYAEVGDERQEALTLHHRGYALLSLDEIPAALTDFERALPLWEQVGDTKGQALTLNELGILHRKLGEGATALAIYERALGLWRQLGDRNREAQTLHNRGWVYALLGQQEQALADFEGALALRQQALASHPDQPGQVIFNLNSLGLFEVRRGRPEAAEGHFKEALTLLGEPVGGRPPEEQRGVSLLGLAELRRARAETAPALEAAGTALEIFRARGDRGWQAGALGTIGRLLLDGGDPAAAREHFAAALALFTAIRERSGEAEARLGLARAERRLGHPEAAWREVEEALATVEDLRSRAARGPELRASFFATRQSYYDFAISLQMEQEELSPGSGHGAAAFAIHERARARSLLELLAGAQTPVTGDPEEGDAAALALSRQLEQRIKALEVRLMGLAAGAEDPDRQARMRSLESEQGELLRLYEQAQEQIRLTAPDHAALTLPRTLGAAEIQARLLDRETLLLAYRLGDEESFLWALSTDSLATFRLPGREQIEDEVRLVRELLVADHRRSRQRLEILLATLSQRLLAPAWGLAAGKKRLLIVADGALQYLPFAALPTPAPPAAPVTPAAAATPGGEAEPLVARHELVHLPSASTLALLRQQAARQQAALQGAARQGEPPGPRMGTLAVVGDPVFAPGDPYRPLPYAGREAAALLALVPAGERLAALGSAANRDRVTGGELGRYRILHFATHGEIDTEHPELSRLVLSRIDGTGAGTGHPRDDGLLYALDIYRLRLPAELVVLSACRTALGRRIRGEGLVGLTRAFFHAGASRVVVSLWKVDDESTAELMERFYRHLLVAGQSPAAALREAQNEMRHDPRWRSPLHWAGFILEGEWRDLSRGSGEKPAR